MLKYLVILLDDTSVSYCHYEIPRSATSKLIAVEDLRRAIRFGMKENLMIQVVYPNYQIPQEYTEIINQIDHTEIRPLDSVSAPESVLVVEINELDKTNNAPNLVVRASLSELSKSVALLGDAMRKHDRINIVIKEIESIQDKDIIEYRSILDRLSLEILNIIKTEQKLPQINILTDRMQIDKMVNCNAGNETVTIAPDGKFYICPAFYYDGEIGIYNDERSLEISDRELYDLAHAPICRECDAFHCHRCVWLNKNKTLEVNTPGHMQCVIAHTERNASRDLLYKIREIGEFMPEINIPEIDYLDPFDKLIKQKS